MNTTPERLLAKSVPETLRSNDFSVDSVYLPYHTRDVHAAAVQVLANTGRCQLMALGLQPQIWSQRLERVVRLAAALHDLGKANDHFQTMVRGRGSISQALRHEWVSLLLVDESPLRMWLHPLFEGEPVDWLALTAAIAGHHPAFGRPSPPQKAQEEGTGSTLTLFTDHPDFVAALEWIGETFQLGSPPSYPRNTLPLVGKESAFRRLQAWYDCNINRWDELAAESRRFVASAKACLIAADVAGSALPRVDATETQRRQWIPHVFAQVLSTDDLSSIIADRLGCPRNDVNTHLRPFQRQVAERSGPVTFVKAGCGSGKTLAAYHWALQCHPGRRLYICYPTTGTATEGFRDYLFDLEESTSKYGAELFHSRSSVDLEVILGVSGDQDEKAGDGDDTLIRIQSLAAWSTPIVACTVDRVLGLLQNHRAGLYAWPALTRAAFVFDEIHAYDDRLFGSLLRFLRDLPGLPVLLMTASLPRARFDALNNVMKCRGQEMPVIEGPADFERRPRYSRDLLPVVDPPLERIKKEVDRGGKVLWVCNTVNRVLEAASLADRAGLAPLVYHSRFCYIHRVRRHADVLKAFRADGPALAICSQVAEMSLDLSATLLVTDLAPVPAMIQRLGRLNRRAREDDPTCPFIVIDPTDKHGQRTYLPYSKVDLESALCWLQGLPQTCITQSDLTAAWERCAIPHSGRYSRLSTWLDSGPATTVGDLREPSHGITVVYPYFGSDGSGKTFDSLLRVLLPMPPPPQELEWRAWPRRAGVPVAPKEAIDYNEMRGAQWRN